VEVTVDDVVAANGPRIPSSDELLAGQRQDYFREVQVVVTRPGEPASSPLASQVAQRIDRARLLWEKWMREATRNRMVVCTQVSRDCGDPRSDVVDLRFNPTQRAPGWGPLPVEVTVENPGQREATGVTVTLDTDAEGTLGSLDQKVGNLPVGGSRKVTFNVDLRGVACGAELKVKASTQGDFHYHRRLQHLVLGAESAAADGFEADSGWVVNPDGDDSSAGAVWERGTPERTEIVAGSAVQPDGAHQGTGAWVTGLARPGRQPRSLRARRAHHRAVTGVRRHRLEGAPGPLLGHLRRHEGGPRGPGRGGQRSVAPAGAGPRPARRQAAQGAAAGWRSIGLQDQLTIGWILRSVRLPRELEKHKIQVRFVAEDANPQNGGVEAAVDDFEITSNLPACYQPPPATPKSGGCALAPGAPPAGIPLILLALISMCVRRWRRGR
jgi:hypothetical protein